MVEWQTRQFEGLVVVIPCGFKSRPAHQILSHRNIIEDCRSNVYRPKRFLGEVRVFFGFGGHDETATGEAALRLLRIERTA